MDNNLKISLWQQFGASIDYLINTVEACPEGLWKASLWDTDDKPPELAQFWYVAYHSAFWLHLYLTGAEEGFLPPLPFALIEQDEYGPIPEHAYTKREVLDYLQAGRAACRVTIDGLTDAMVNRQCTFGWGSCSFFELLIYNMRHVHGHASQLNMLLGQNRVATPDYPTRVDH